jgi:hypothetical protein
MTFSPAFLDIGGIGIAECTDEEVILRKGF